MTDTNTRKDEVTPSKPTPTHEAPHEVHVPKAMPKPIDEKEKMQTPVAK